MKRTAVVRARCWPALRQPAEEPWLELERSAGTMFYGQHAPMLYEPRSLAAKDRRELGGRLPFAPLRPFLHQQERLSSDAGLMPAAAPEKEQAQRRFPLHLLH